jgi:MFS transporter, DHA3 family, macrolide efflux protein
MSEAATLERPTEQAELTPKPSERAAVKRAVADTPPEPQRGWELFKNRDFSLLWWGQAISQVGDGLNKVALLWFVYTLTGSAMKMTVIGLLQTLPPLAFGALIGVYLDRLPKKPVMIWVDLIRTGLVLLIPVLHGLDMLSLEGLYGLVFAIAIVSTIFGPALSSAVPLIVKRSQLTAGNALIQSTTTIGILIGPAISGIGIALIGAQNVLYVNAVTFFISALCLIPIRLRESRASEVQARSSVIRDLVVGYRFVFVQHPAIFVLMITAALYSLAASAFIFMLPVFAKEVLGVGPTELGWLWSAQGIGMLATSLWLASLKHQAPQQRLQIIVRSMAVGGIAACTLSLLETALLATAVVIVIGASFALFIPVVWGVLQELTPEHLLGRVFTMFSTGGMAFAMAGMAGFGWAADTIGPTSSLIGIGIVLLGTALTAAHFTRRVTLPQPAHAH